MDVSHWITPIPSTLGGTCLDKITGILNESVNQAELTDAPWMTQLLSYTKGQSVENVMRASTNFSNARKSKENSLKKISQTYSLTT